MHDQRSAGGSSLTEADDPASIILYILLREHPGLLHVDELVRIYARGSIEQA